MGHTYILNPEDVAEMARLEMQAQLLTNGMGGVLPEWQNLLPAGCFHILDLACGTGEWVRRVARDFPQTQVIGIDSSAFMIAYAQDVASGQQNARFFQSEVLHVSLPPASCDLLNARMLVGVVPRDDWPAFLRECRRLLRPGGVLRLVEHSDPPWRTNKEVCEKLGAWAIELGTRAGYGFATPTSSGWRMIQSLQSLLEKEGWRDIHTHDYPLDSSFGTPLYESQKRNVQLVWQQARPLVLQEKLATETEFELLYETMQQEMAEPDFQGLWQLCTVSASA